MRPSQVLRASVLGSGRELRERADVLRGRNLRDVDAVRQYVRGRLYGAYTMLQRVLRAAGQLTFPRVLGG